MWELLLWLVGRYGGLYVSFGLEGKSGRVSGRSSVREMGEWGGLEWM